MSIICVHVHRLDLTRFRLTRCIYISKRHNKKDDFDLVVSL